MNYKPNLRVSTLIGLVIASQSALAVPIIDLTYVGSANFGSGAVGYFNGSIAPNPNSSTSLVAVAIGGLGFTSPNHDYDFSASGQINAWCIDIYHWLSRGTNAYVVGNESDLTATLNSLRPGIPGGATRVNHLGNLANEVYSLVDTKTESAAFQLAVWAIAYGTADASGRYHISTTDVNFRVDSVTAASPFGVLANSWLANLGNAPDTGNYTLSYLHDGTRNNTQDMIVFARTPTIPEPGSMALLGLGLLGFGFSRRKPHSQCR